ncbi:HupE/UreJ family protein [Shimia abyssi]|uniref:HupE/UreJ protein n=1 Tax=Shimia abyssi TaxID=1662395 RepID=A0A2P8F8J7_9RHOB|nr:HupE/UreJ family protein [Shimia abyssi]PSL18037.1 HupE/UreJ protein [Shimia abyssi]
MIRFAFLLLTLVALPRLADAHALQPGYLDISRITGDSYRVFWRKPDVKGSPMAIDPALPETCTPVSGPEPRSDGAAWVSTWVAECPGGFAGKTIGITGLENTQTDVLVRYVDTTETTRSQRLTPDKTIFTVPENPSAFDVIATYLPLGVEHILGGIDHLLFVFALLLLIRDRWRLIGAITAFTIAHSITMAAATLGWVALPGPPVEAIIALSIMFVASELIQRKPGQERLSERFPWSVSFTFGLLHGFGFAGALREIGVPQTDVPLALLSFNLGVEIGQLSFVAVVLALGWVLRRISTNTALSLATGTHAAVLSAYAIGGVSAYWFLDRLSGF